MVKNVRWLYSKLGTDDFSTTGSDTVTGALSNLQSGLDGKAESSHSHTTDTLPVSNNQVNSVNYIPTSALLYSMSMRAEGIQSVVGIAKRELDDPNKRYESKNLGTWSSLSQVDTFLSTYTHENNYEGLSLGNYVTIQDGTYNVAWEIAGFDMECMQTAADGTIYDNGYGICLIPRSAGLGRLFEFPGAKTDTVVNISALENVLGDNIIERNILRNDIFTNYVSSGYTWTTSKSTSPSVGQFTGTFASHSNKYDDGEANYRLPLFNYENTYWSATNGSILWTRGIKGPVGRDLRNAWGITIRNDITYAHSTSGTVNGLRPLIYIR